MWKNKNILITGLDHFLAIHLAEKLADLGSNIRGLIQYDYQHDSVLFIKLPSYIAKKVEVISGYLTNPDFIDYSVKNTDIIFHFGLFDMMPFPYNTRDYLENTFLGTLNILMSAAKHKTSRIVHISTGEVYGKTEKTPINEECELKAQGQFVSGDIAAEKLVEAFYNSDNLPVTIARLFNSYGPIQKKSAIIPTIITQVLNEEEILLGDMHSIRDFIYVDDVIDCLLKIAESPESIGEAINIGTGHGISIGELADKIISLIGKDISVIFDATRIRLFNSGIDKVVADITKAKNLLKWNPKVDLDSGLIRTIEWYSRSI